MVIFPEDLACETARRRVSAASVGAEMAAERGDLVAVDSALAELAVARAELSAADARRIERRPLRKALLRMQAVNACRRYALLPAEQQFLGATW